MSTPSSTAADPAAADAASAADAAADAHAAPPGRPSGRLAAALSGLAVPARALVNPVDGVPPAVSEGRWAPPLALAAGAAALAGAVFALRWDVEPAVVARLAQAGELAKVTEQELLEQVQVAGRTRLVGGVAAGLALVPLKALGMAAVLGFTGWLLGVKGAFQRLLAAVSVGLLPVALGQVLFALCALRQGGLSEAQAAVLLPSHLGAFFPQAPQKLAGALAAVDFFNLWSVALVGLGFATATGMRRGRAVLLAAALYALYVGVFVLGLPGMAGGRS
jgi:hypothetical protein